jgi:hypothetical protein
VIINILEAKFVADYQTQLVKVSRFSSVRYTFFEITDRIPEDTFFFLESSILLICFSNFTRLKIARIKIEPACGENLRDRLSHVCMLPAIFTAIFHREFNASQILDTDKSKSPLRTPLVFHRRLLLRPN